MSLELSTISLTEQTNFRLNEINKIKHYFESETKDWETAIKKLNKYITGCDHADKNLIALSATFSGISIISHLKIKKHTGLISPVFILVFSLNKAVIKKLLSETKKRKNKHSKLV